MRMEEHWTEIKHLFRRSFTSSFHYAIATVDENGGPHISPIGSLLLGAPGRGLYFEEFPKQLPRNLRTNKKICVLAVNSSRWFWLKSLLGGKFVSPPAVRLYGTAGELREATEQEIQLWQRRVRRVRFTKGHAMMWAKMRTVRDIEFLRAEPVLVGTMTEEAWRVTQ